MAIDKSVLMGFPWQDPGLLQMHNDYLIEAANCHPQRLIPFCQVILSKGADAELEIDRCTRKGAKGVGELILDYKNTAVGRHDGLQPIAKILKNKSIPVLIHVNTTNGRDHSGKGKPEWEKVSRIIASHPDLDIILAHWGGGLMFFELMPEIAKLNQRVYYDTAATPFFYNPQIYSIAARIIGSDRILFGTDLPLIRAEKQVQDIKSENLSPQVEKAILGENAKKLLHL